MREDWVEVRIVVDHRGTVAHTIYTNAGRASEIAHWLRELANQLHPDVTP